MTAFEHTQFGSDFQVDDGQLDGLSPQEIFVLGVEYGMILNALYVHQNVDKPIHTNNEVRIRALLDDANAPYTLSVHDDWPILQIWWPENEEAGDG